MPRHWQPRLPLPPELWGKPQVHTMADLLGIDRWSVVGRIIRIWVLAQERATPEGILEGKGPAEVDLLVGQPGFAGAMIKVGWLAAGVAGVKVPEFDKFVSKRAIRRIEASDRQSERRNRKADTTTHDVSAMSRIVSATTPYSAHPAGKDPTKKKAKVSEIDPLFDRFWAAYPRKASKSDAVKAFAKLAVDEGLLTRMLAALGRQARSEQWVKDGGQFIPYPATWLNARRWEDEPDIGGPVQSGPRVQPTPGQFSRKRVIRSEEGDSPDPGAGRTLFDS